MTKLNNNCMHNGHENYQTYNVILWLSNDEGLYSMAKCYKNSKHPYKTFISELKDVWNDKSIGYETPDGISWNDSSLDISSIDEFIRTIE